MRDQKIINLWQKIQNRCWRDYLRTKDYRGTFSIDGLKGAKLTGELINDIIPGGVCLDVGCGIMPRPFYMKVADKVKFIGVDPLKGDKKREFEFFNAKAEKLPFNNSIFDGVLFATSLDHVIDINKSISEAYRVLKTDGHLFIWTSIKKNNKSYDNLHMRVFTDNLIRELFHDFKFIEIIKVRPKINNESIYHFMKCRGE